MKIYPYQEKEEFLKEYFDLCSKEWGNYSDSEEYRKKREKKIEKLKEGNSKIISILFLIESNNLIGFISLFQSDSLERLELTPWYATMYVKLEYRGKGYSKILNNAILKEAKRLGYEKVYLKTELNNYYEKFGARYLDKLENNENLYVIDTNYQLVPSKESDIEKILQYKLNSILDYAKDLKEEEEKEIIDYVNANVPKSISNYKSIIVDEKVVGCLLVEKENDGVLVDEIYLEEEHRGKGIGTSILKNVIKENNIVYLWVYKLNKNAIKLYEKLGFSTIKETETRYYMNLHTD